MLCYINWVLQNQMVIHKSSKRSPQPPQKPHFTNGYSINTQTTAEKKRQLFQVGIMGLCSSKAIFFQHSSSLLCFIKIPYENKWSKIGYREGKAVLLGWFDGISEAVKGTFPEQQLQRAWWLQIKLHRITKANL